MRRQAETIMTSKTLSRGLYDLGEEIPQTTFFMVEYESEVLRERQRALLRKRRKDALQREKEVV